MSGFEGVYRCGYLCHDGNVVPLLLTKVVNEKIQGDLNAHIPNNDLHSNTRT